MDGTKMSKSKGNLVAPARYYDTVGADGLRLFHLFVGPPADDFDWTDQTDQIIEGCGRFLDRLWRLVTDARGAARRRRSRTADDVEVRRATHRTIEQVSADLDRWSYNTAVAHCMELVNLLQRYVRSADGPHADVLRGGLRRAAAPARPDDAARHRRALGAPPRRRAARSTPQPWPAFDPDLVAEETVTMVVQVNGKVRDRIEVDPAIDEEEADRPRPGVAQGGSRPWRAGRPARVVARPPSLVNVVV